MDVVLIGQMDDAAKTPIYCDKYAAEADGIILFNKVNLIQTLKAITKAVFVNDSYWHS